MLGTHGRGRWGASLAGSRVSWPGTAGGVNVSCLGNAANAVSLDAHMDGRRGGWLVWLVRLAKHQASGRRPWLLGKPPSRQTINSQRPKSSRPALAPHASPASISAVYIDTTILPVPAEPVEPKPDTTTQHVGRAGRLAELRLPPPEAEHQSTQLVRCTRPQACPHPEREEQQWYCELVCDYRHARHHHHRAAHVLEEAGCCR